MTLSPVPFVVMSSFDKGVPAGWYMVLEFEEFQCIRLEFFSLHVVLTCFLEVGIPQECAQQTSYAKRLQVKMASL